MAVAACGDDEGTTTDTTTTSTATTPTDTTVTDTTVTETTTDPDGTTTETTVTETTTETEVSDPCATNPCTNPPAAMCDADGMVVTYAAPGTCTAVGGAAQCAYDDTATACTDAKVCANGACVAGADACSYEFDAKASFVTSIKLGNKDGAEGACCFDFNDDGKVDNKLGSILKNFANLFDVDKTITDQITAGKLVLLLETPGVDDVANDTDLNVFGFYGALAAGTTAETALAGNGSFVANKSSFQPGTDTPLIAFEHAKIESGMLKAGPALFGLSIPIVGAQLDIKVSRTKIEGDAGDGPNATGGLAIGQTGLGAKLGGVIAKTDLISALNAYITTCDCVNFQICEGTTTACTADADCTTGAKKCVTSAADHVLIGTDGLCNAAATDTCGTDDAACKQIPGFCAIVLAALSPDVDLDGDGTKDGISVGVWVKATSATITAVQDLDSSSPPVDQCSAN